MKSKLHTLFIIHNKLHTDREIQGNVYTGACSLLEGGIYYGKCTGALPDGRLKGELLGNSMNQRKFVTFWGSIKASPIFAGKISGNEYTADITNKCAEAFL